jgi:hypothetical protein
VRREKKRERVNIATRFLEKKRGERKRGGEGKERVNMAMTYIYKKIEQRKREERTGEKKRREERRIKERRGNGTDFECAKKFLLKWIGIGFFPIVMTME